MKRFLSGFGFCVIWAATGVIAGELPSEGTSRTKPPNVIVIFADDLGYGDLGCYGQRGYKTPALDQMAEQGVRLTDFYVASPACSPSRAALLTGLYPLRAGVPQVLGPKAVRGIHPQTPMLPQILRENGYSTAAIGKWHVGHTPELMPLRRGFDYFFGLPYSNDMKPAPLYRNDEVIEPEANQSQLTKRYTDETLAFVDRSVAADKPFFIYLAHTFPHVPLHVSEEFRGSSGAGLYGDVITELDASVGRVMRHLQDTGLSSRTLVIFSSDNGPWTIKKEHGGSTGGLRGAKGTDYEGGIRVPFMAWWPGVLPEGRVVQEPAITLDIMPTILRLAGVKDKPGLRRDGVDIWPLLKDGNMLEKRAMYFPDYYLKNPVGAVRYGDYKLVTGRVATGKHDARTTELFNLKQDPQELNDRSGRHPEMVSELAAKADVMRAELEGANPW